MEYAEFLGLIFADDQMLRGESVADGVLGDAGLAFDGARAGGELRVRLIGDVLRRGLP